MAEHHGMTGIASAATAVVLGHIAGGTKSIRVGSGGVMLPNHSPLVIAEQFGTLQALYGDRVDLGLGRAPGTDMRTAQALRRDFPSGADTFPQDVVELLQYLGPPQADAGVKAVPGTGSRVPVWLLGSSTFGAQLAARLGLPFAFASHFAPGMLMQALQVYRASFRPSEYLARPYAMVGVNIFAADTEADAKRLATSLQQAFIHLRRGTPGPLAPPVDTMDGLWSAMERAGVEQALAYSAIGTPDAVQRQLDAIITETGADELMLTGQIFDHAARLRSFEIAAEVRGRIAAQRAA
jgi:luciferase family oxidoreductase group 1